MDKPGLSDRLLTLLPGGLLLVSLLAFAIFNDRGIEWVGQFGKISCAFFWFMPFVYLLVRPNLAIHFFNHLTRSRSKFDLGLDKPDAIQKSDWKRLNTGEMAMILLAAVAGVVIGGFLIANAFGLFPPE